MENSSLELSGQMMISFPSSSCFYLSNINKVSCTSSREQARQITPVTQAFEQVMKGEVGKHQGLKEILSDDTADAKSLQFD